MRSSAVVAVVLLGLSVAPSWALEGKLVGTGWGGSWYASGDLVVVDCATGSATTIVQGACYGACFSPDGTRIAYFKDQNSIWICNLDGSNNHQVTTNTGWSAESHSCANWVAGDWIYWGAGPNLKRVKIDGSQRNDNVDVLPWDLMTCRVSQDATRGACFTWGWEAKAFVVGGARYSLGGGCQGSISPNGEWCTHNIDHRKITIHRFSDQVIVADRECASGDANNYAFSHLSNDYVCYTINGGSAYVMHWQSGTNYFVANGIKGWDYNPNAGTPPQLTSIQISPAGASVQFGGSQQFTAQPKDQYGNNFNATVNWSLTGGGSISPTSGNVTTFTAGGVAGTWQLTASSGSVSASVNVTVFDPSALHIKLDCGTDSPVSGWQKGNDYVTGGANYSGLPTPGNLGSLVNPAPAALYNTCRHSADHSYSIPVPNGTYLVRIHFSDHTDSNRKMRYRIEGVDVLVGYDPPDNSAEIKEFPNVLVTDGNVTIQAFKEDGNDVFECGIEIVAGGTALRDPENPSGAVSGLNVSYYELSSPGALPNFGSLTAYKTDTVAEINYPSTDGNFATSGRADNVGAVFTGYVQAPSDGVYTFYTTSDDGSALYIGATKVVDNDGTHGMQERSGQIGLKAGKHALRVEFFEAGGGAGLVVSWEGPGVGKQTIPASALFRSGSAPVLTTIDVNPSSSTIAVDGTQSLTAAPRDQFGNIIQATIVWSSSGGTVSPSTGLSVTFIPSGTGVYTVTASSGGVSGSATITVTDAPTVTVTSPASGDVWYIGTTRRIRWQTTNLNNVSVFYSPDGGTTLQMIWPTVWNTDAAWGDAPWTIAAGPGLPSDQCRIVVTSYNTETRGESPIFRIAQIVDNDGDGMDDGWEVSTFGDTSHDQTSDADGDGATDYEEFMSGTDPLVAEGGGGGGGFSLSCAARSGAGRAALSSLAALLLGCLAFSRVLGGRRQSAGMPR